MGNIRKVGARNNVDIAGRRYSISELISESYQTLYSCDLDSRMYKLVEGHIADLKMNPSDTERLSANLEILKGLSRLGESAEIEDTDLLDDEEEELEEEFEFEDDEELEIPEDDELEESDEEFDYEDDEDLEEDDEIIDDEEELEEEDMGEDPEDDITPEELQELKAHLRRTRESKRALAMTAAKVAKKAYDNKKSPVKESKSWRSEQVTMKKALKNFRESSNKKAFMKSFSKLQERMDSKEGLTLEESLLLFKASNSAMTHLAVELEHNPDFIYTFRECTSILARDNEELLECIRRQESPNKSLVESFRTFSNILLESEEVEDLEVEDEEDVVVESEDQEDPASEEEELEEEEEEILDDEEEIIESEDGVVETPEDEELEESDDEEEILDDEEDVLESEEVEDEEEEMIESDDDELDPEITDDEAEELKRHLAEIRKNRVSK